MKIYLYSLFLLIFLAGCESSKKNYDFTFFKWNIHESYYLKFNSSDTLYYIKTHLFEEQTSYTILNKHEKERIQNTLENLSFPKEKEFSSSVEDGQLNAFYLKKDKQYQQLLVHGHQGPNQFRLFGKTLETIKNQHSFTKINKKFDLTKIKKMVAPPILFEEK